MNELYEAIERKITIFVRKKAKRTSLLSGE